MAGKTSTIQAAESMTLNVAISFRKTHDRMQTYLKHLNSRKAHLEALLAKSHQSDVAAMLAVVNAAIASLIKAMAIVLNCEDRAKKIEARL